MKQPAIIKTMTSMIQNKSSLKTRKMDLIKLFRNLTKDANLLALSRMPHLIRKIKILEEVIESISRAKEALQRLSFGFIMSL